MKIHEKSPKIFVNTKYSPKHLKKRGWGPDLDDRANFERSHHIYMSICSSGRNFWKISRPRIFVKTNHFLAIFLSKYKIIRKSVKLNAFSFNLDKLILS